MAATIAKSYCGLNHCIFGIKNVQLGTQRPTVFKDVYRSAWYRSFFRSDQPTAPKETANSGDTLDSSLSKPKRPANVFLLYVQDVQNRIKQSNPDFKRQQIIELASKEWRELDPETKSKYALDRKEMMEKYKIDMMNYVENRTPDQIKMEKTEKDKKEFKKLKKARKQLGRPTRYLAPFACYLSEKFAERSNEPIQEYFKQIKDSWNDLSEKEKEVYVERSMESHQQYQDAMADWEERMIEMGRFDVLRKKTLKQLKAAEQGKGMER